MNVKIDNKRLFYTSLGISVFLILSYFIKFQIDAGANYTVKDSLLGILVFHNIYVISAYILVLAILFAKSLEFR